VVLEHPPQVGQAGDQHQVPEEDRDPDQLLDDHEHERVRQRVAEDVRDPDREQEEQADRQQQREHHRAGPGALADLLHLTGLAGGELGVGRDVQRAEADLQRLPQRDDPADHRQAQPPVLLEDRDERERLDLDLAVRALARIDPAVVAGDVLGGGLAHRHRPRRDPAHHHALEHGLPADRRIAARHQRAVGKPRLLGCRHYRRRFAARRWKRSTRPPVSTSFWRPV
jgi:hypothetical protein